MIYETTERVVVIYLIACGCLSISQKRVAGKIIFGFSGDDIEDRMAEYKSGKPTLVDYRMVVFAENWFNTIIHEL